MSTWKSFKAQKLRQQTSTFHKVADKQQSFHSYKPFQEVLVHEDVDQTMNIEIEYRKKHYLTL